MSNTDNFDPPEDVDLDQIPDRDVDFDDFEDNKDKSLGGSWKNSALVKFGVVALVIVIVITLVSILGSDKIAAPTSVVGKGAGAGFKQAPGIAEVTPVMNEAIQEKNDQRIDEAQKQGMSAIPTPIAPPKTLLEVPQDDAQSDDPLLRWQQMQTERAKAQREQQMLQEQQTTVDPQRDGKVTALAQSMSQQVGAILGEQKHKDMQHMSVFAKTDMSKAVDSNGNPVMSDASLNGVNQASPQKAAKVIVPAGKIEYAQMILEANSDIPGPVVALIASGQFNGGKLIGKFQSQEEYLVITFSQLITKKGTSIPINAYALDPGTSLTGLATDVDHRYFKRIVLPAAAKFVQGLGDAYAQTTSQTTQNATTTTTSTTDLNTKQEFGKAVSSAAQSIGDVLADDGKNTKPLVVVAAGTPMGILFMNQITDKDVLQARSGVSATTQQQSPQQGPYPTQIFQQQQPGIMNQMQQLQSGLQGQQYMQQNTPTTTYTNGLPSTYNAGTTGQYGQ
jgi:intracellular multiplication protein IcmE